MKKKLYFLISANRDQQQQYLPIFAILPSGTLQENVVAPMTTNLITGRLDWNASEKQKLTARYELHIDNADDLGVGGFGLPETGSTRFHHDYRVELSDQYIFSPDVLNVFKLALSKNYEQLTSTSTAPLIVVQGAFQQGGGHANEWRQEPRHDVLDTLSVSQGSRTWKAGVDTKFHPIDSYDADNFGGTYNFASLAAYAANRPTLFSVNGGDPYLAFRQNEYAWFLQIESSFRTSLLSPECEKSFNQAFRAIQISRRGWRWPGHRGRHARLLSGWEAEFSTTAGHRWCLDKRCAITARTHCSTWWRIRASRWWVRRQPLQTRFTS